MIFAFILTWFWTTFYFCTIKDISCDDRTRIEESTDFLHYLKGPINDCNCTVELIDKFNVANIYPRISTIVRNDYFRFYKVNLRSECPFWKGSSQCAMRYCQVESCLEKDIPEGIKGKAIFKDENHRSRESVYFKYSAVAQTSDCDDHTDKTLGYLNTTISAHNMEDFALWQAFDGRQDLYCILPDEDGEAQYVDLALNPERYTGYRGYSAHKIWTVIYKENCFRPHDTDKSSLHPIYIQSSKLNGMCVEKRAFYRAISGLHASINVHLSAKYLLNLNQNPLAGICGESSWGHNVSEFVKKFSPATTNGEGLEWLRNLYFLYIVELRAICKASPYLMREHYYTGNVNQDKYTQEAVTDFLEIANSFDNHFNENAMFSGGSEATKLKEEFRQHFRNVSKIMDCVGCDKCKLWGKLQIQGLGTAFKILFSGKFEDNNKDVSGNNISLLRRSFQLERSEIVALFNGFARLSTSIFELQNFRHLNR